MWFPLHNFQIHFRKIGEKCGLSQDARKEIRRQGIRQPDAHHGSTTGNGDLQLAESSQDTSHFLTNLLPGSRQLRTVFLARQQHFSASLPAAEFCFQVIDLAGHSVAGVESASLELLAKFLCIPPDKLTSHKALLRMWIAALLTTVLRREKCPEKKTLFILDECAQLGTMPLLEQAVTLLRGYGLQVWTFWQDMEQVRSNYPNRHETLINNAAVLQAFGISNSMMARQLTEVLDCSSADLLAMKNEESRVFMKGQGSRTCRLPDYLHDAAFKGLWDNNPFFGGPSAGGVPIC